MLWFWDCVYSGDLRKAHRIRQVIFRRELDYPEFLKNTHEHLIRALNRLSHNLQFAEPDFYEIVVEEIKQTTNATEIIRKELKNVDVKQESQLKACPYGQNKEGK
jgi:hypothetical protein